MAGKSAFDQAQNEAYRKILHFKAKCESSIVSIIYKEPNGIHGWNLTVNDFHNDMWRLYFQIAQDMVTNEKKNMLDEFTVDAYLAKHHDIKKEYESYGGYSIIVDAGTCTNAGNLDGYVMELRKWNAVTRMCQKGFPVKDRVEAFISMDADEIYNEYEAFLNDIFGNIDSDVKSYDICDGIHELIEKLDEGYAIGLPYYDMPMLTKVTGGQYMGSITLLGGLSNVGKSTVARSTTIPSIINMNEKILIMVNEDSLAKWQREMLVWICNNILKFDIQKHIVRDGKYIPEVKKKLHEAADWLEEKTKNHMVTVIPFLQYQTKKAIKEIRKYAAMGVKYFILDTFKMDAGKVSANSWLEMQQSMVAIKDTVKAEALNVHALITFQLEKGSSVIRYYTQNNIGLAKNIVDAASTCIMIRDVFYDEYPKGKRAFRVYQLNGKNGKKVEVFLNKEKQYQIFFIIKNQEGASNSFQIVVEHDKSRNIINEVGITNILPDNF